METRDGHSLENPKTSVPTTSTWRKEAVSVAKFLLRPFSLAKLSNAEFVDIITFKSMKFDLEEKLTEEENELLATQLREALAADGLRGFAWEGTEDEKWCRDLCGCALIWRKMFFRAGVPPSLVITVPPGEPMTTRQKAEKLADMFGIDRYVDAWFMGIPLSDIFGCS